MKERCYNPKDSSYYRYGGRGIGVCDRWLNSFENFLEDVGEPPDPSMTLDRYPNQDGNYEPGNVRWATAQEQHRNKSTNRLIEYNGETLPLIVWCERLNLKYTTTQMRLDSGWPVEAAFTLPKRARWRKVFAAR